MAQIQFEPQLNASAFIMPHCALLNVVRCVGVVFFFIIIIWLCIHKWVLIFGNSVEQQVLINAQRYPLCVNNSLSFMASVWFGWLSTNYSLSQYNTRFQTHSATFNIKANYAKMFAFCVNEWIKTVFWRERKKRYQQQQQQHEMRKECESKTRLLFMCWFLFYFHGMFNAVRTVFLLCFENSVFVHILWSVGEKWA